MLKGLALIFVGLILGLVISTTPDTLAHDPHEVAKGDTLWGIVESHTGDPLNWVSVCDRIVDDLDRDAQRRGQSSSRYCSRIWPGTPVDVSGTGGENGNGSDEGPEPTAEDPPSIRCDGVIVNTVDGPVCRASGNAEVYIESLKKRLECQGLWASSSTGDFCISRSPLSDGEIDLDLFRSMAGAVDDDIVRLLLMKELLADDNDGNGVPWWAFAASVGGIAGLALVLGFLLSVLAVVMVFLARQPTTNVVRHRHHHHGVFAVIHIFQPESEGGGEPGDKGPGGGKPDGDQPGDGPSSTEEGEPSGS